MLLHVNIVLVPFFLILYSPSRRSARRGPASQNLCVPLTESLPYHSKVAGCYIFGLEILVDLQRIASLAQNFV